MSSENQRLGYADRFPAMHKLARKARPALRATRSVKALSAICLLATPTLGNATPLELRSFTGLAQRCGSTVAALTLAAIAKTESRFETLVVADNTTRKSRVYPTLPEAAAAAERLIASGHSVDIGMMQINSANLRRLRMTARDVLDPCRAIQAAASILTGNFLASKSASTRQIALRNALSMYNTGNARYGYTNGYVRRVEQAALSLAPHIGSSGGAQLAMYVAPGLRPSPGTGPSPGPSRQAPSAPDPWDVWNVGMSSPTSNNGNQNPNNFYVL